ncbi:unnamed protein product, partial [Porites evermanni]
GPQYSFVIKKAFSCQTFGLVYCISYRRCPAVYIGETGRTLRQPAHSIDDALVRGMMLSVDNAQRKCD